MTDQEYWNRRARGMGGTFTTCAEENVLGYPGTRYYGEHILVHEFSHSVEGSLRRVDSTLHAELQAAYEDVRQCARNATLRREHAGQYWAEGTQWWFWNNYPEVFLTNGTEHSVWSPDDLERYDPKLYAILAKVYPDH